MRRILILLLSLITSLSIAGTPTINPTTCFDNYPWATTQKNKTWKKADEDGKILRQLWYPLEDRCFVADVYLKPLVQRQYTLSCGYPTLTDLRIPGTTNKVQLLMNQTREDVVVPWTYFYPNNPQEDKFITLTNSMAYPVMTRSDFLELVNTLEIICKHYVPAKLYENDLQVYFTASDTTNMPYYVNVGALLKEAGYDSCVSNIVYDAGGWITSCDYSFNEFSFPTNDILAGIGTSWNTNTLKLAACDCFAACVAQLKYLRCDAVPCIKQTDYSDRANTWTYNSWDFYSGPTAGIGGPGDYGQGGGVLGYSWLATSHDFDWAMTDWSQYVDDVIDTYEWRDASSIYNGFKVTGGRAQGDWPLSGWEGMVDLKENFEIQISDSDSDKPYPGDYWRVTLGTYGDYYYGVYDGLFVARDGTRNTNITLNLSASGNPLVGVGVTMKPYNSDAFNYTTRYHPGHDETYTYHYNYRSYVTGTEYNVSAYIQKYAWEFENPGTTDIFTYCYLEWQGINTPYYFANYYKTIPMYFTNQIYYDVTLTMTNWMDPVIVTTYDSYSYTYWVPEHTETNWDESYPKYPIYTDGVVYPGVDFGSAKNKIIYNALIYDARPNLSYVVKDEPEYIDNTFWILGGNLDDMRGTDPILIKPEWDDLGYTWLRPLASWTNAIEDKVVKMSPGDMSDYVNNMIYWLPNGGWLSKWDHLYDPSLTGPRYWYGLKQGWFVIKYDFPKRGYTLPYWTP